MKEIIAGDGKVIKKDERRLALITATDQYKEDGLKKLEAPLILNIGRLPDDDILQLEQLTHRLRAELRDLGVEDVEVVKPGRAPEGSKAGAGIPAWESLRVDSSVLPAIVGTVKSWLKLDENLSVTLEIDGDKFKDRSFF
jgi:hypothetical protein